MPLKPSYILLLMLLSMASCREQDVFKVPTDVAVIMDVRSDPSANPSFDGGSVIIESFEFEGRREVGDDVEFEKEFEPGLSVQFDSENLVDAIGFTVPQGNYSRIEVSIDLDHERSPDLVINGAYTKLNNEVVPILFEFDDSKQFRMRMRDESDNTTIPLAEDRLQKCLIRLDPASWFATVPTSYLEQAETSSINGTPTIVVSDEMNENIFELVVNRLDEGNDCRIRFE